MPVPLPHEQLARSSDTQCDYLAYLRDLEGRLRLVEPEVLSVNEPVYTFISNGDCRWRSATGGRRPHPFSIKAHDDELRNRLRHYQARLRTAKAAGRYDGGTTLKHMAPDGSWRRLLLTD